MMNVNRQFKFRIYFETSSTTELAYIDFESDPNVDMEMAWCQAIAHASIYAEHYDMTIKCIMEGMKI